MDTKRSAFNQSDAGTRRNPLRGARLSALLSSTGLIAAGLAISAAAAAPVPSHLPQNLLPTHGGDGSAGFVLSGIDFHDRSGYSVSSAGGVNGDGIGDLIIGAFTASPGGQARAGESYVVFGRNTAQTGNFPARFLLANLFPAAGGDGSAGFVLKGIDTYDLSGFSVGAAGMSTATALTIISAQWGRRGRRYAGGHVVFGRDQSDPETSPRSSAREPVSNRRRRQDAGFVPPASRGRLEAHR
jgi:hypothetical protein